MSKFMGKDAVNLAEANAKYYADAIMADPEMKTKTSISGLLQRWMVRLDTLMVWAVLLDTEK